MSSALPAILTHVWPTPLPSELRVAVYNVGFVVRKPFLRVSPANVQGVVNANVHGAFAFAHGVVEAFQKNTLDAKGKRGTLIFTGATGSLRGGPITSAFSAGKHALRALSQSLSKEFGKDNIHVSASSNSSVGVLTQACACRARLLMWSSMDVSHVFVPCFLCAHGHIACSGYD